MDLRSQYSSGEESWSICKEDVSWCLTFSNVLTLYTLLDDSCILVNYPIFPLPS